MKPLEDIIAKCGTDPFRVVKQAAWSVSEGQDFVVVAELGATEDEALGCIRGVLGRGEPTTFEGKKGVELGDTVIVVDDGHLLVGSKAWLKQTLAGDVPAPGSAKRLSVGRNDALRLVTTRPAKGSAPYKEAELVITTSASEAAIVATVIADDDEGAEAMESKAKEVLSTVTPELKKELPSFTPPELTRDGSRLTLQIVQKGDGAKQMELVGAISAVAVYGVRRYLQSAKSAEAKSTVGAISRGITSYMELEETPGKRPARFPASAPAVPKDIPVGMKYAPTEADWSHPSWKAIRFVMTSPQYYRYRFETSPDGKSCTVIAEGDLDGDGVSSKLSRELKLMDDGSVSVAPQILVENELE